jgi:hypothetical protein
VILCGLFVILFQFADILRFAPSLHLLELGYCKNYYLEHDPRLIDSAGHIPERLCKLQEIQEDLSSIRAWLGFVEGLVGRLGLLYGYEHPIDCPRRPRIGDSLRHVEREDWRTLCRCTESFWLCSF